MGSPLQRKPDHERWFGRARRDCGAATAAIFANPGPSGEGIAAKPLRFCAPETSNIFTTEGVPVMGSGEPNMGTVVPWSRSPSRGGWRFGFLCRHGAKELAARRRRNPLRKPPGSARPGGRALRKVKISGAAVGQTPSTGVRNGEKDSNLPCDRNEENPMSKKEEKTNVMRVLDQKKMGDTPTPPPGGCGAVDG